ncbi:MAG: RhuM [Clostridia bacterium]|nr:RhuM [Clostridia bacterium]
MLKYNGRISHTQATEKANSEYEIFNKTQPVESDFDRAVKRMINAQE